MDVFGPYYGEYGAQSTFYFTMKDAADDDILYTGYAHAAGDSKVYKDGGAAANTTNAVTTTRDPMYSITLTATEMEAEQIVVTIQDQGAEAFEPAVLMIFTKVNLGQLNLDASQLSNVAALNISGQGTGAGVVITGGATGPGADINGGSTSGDGVDIDCTSGSGLSAVSASGAGATLTGGGTGYGLTATGASAAYYNNVFLQQQASEPTSAFGSTSTYGACVQLLSRRWFNKVTVSGTTLTVYRDDASTANQTQSVSDDGSTQTVGAAS